MPSVLPRNQRRRGDRGHLDGPVPEPDGSAPEVVGQSEPVVELPQCTPGIGDHPRGERVDGLDLGEVLTVVERVTRAIGLVISFCTEDSWNAQRTKGWGAPPIAW